MIKKSLLILVAVASFLSCGGNTQSKQEIQAKINDLHSRISVLEQEIPRVRRDIANGVNPEYTTPQQLQEMENNLHDFKIQLDELNRQLVNAK